ncbi:metallophosphoesterase [Plantactinospora sp. KLBMP9567]|uniref:metallophosphoesterase family protein n=1 Tax=Plantactinospora sp. KLBMP9567 TaxID=3085900 RepID=UPI002981E34C|nr:metallophosphoesterase [Plantactinospora sp. KLBMP9567]MDW5329037.1 metallophosphoesterase [Plantactinospora sp. KLBMP9567]
MDRRRNDTRTAGGTPPPAVRRVLLPAALLRWGRTAVRGGRAVLTSKPSRRAGLALSIIGVTVVGIVVGALLGGRMQTDIGPFRAEMAITPSVDGGTTVTIPPLGALQLSSHAGPAHLSVRLGSLDQRRTEALIDDPASISRASQSAVSDVTNGVIRVGVRTVAVSVLATMILAALVFRRTRRVAWAGGLALVITGGSLGIAALTFRPDSIEEPRYEGLLVNAPAIVGDARRIANDYGRYADQLQRMVGNVSQLYTTVSTLPVFDQEQGTVRVLHVSDLHLNPTAWQVVRTVVEQFKIDMVIDTGDITDWGSEPEASFVGSIGLLKVPYVFIRGNHDSPATAAAVGRQPNAIVLDNSIVNVGGLTIAGIGDPRFTPDKETSPAGSGSLPQTVDQVTGTGEKLASTIRASGKPVDIALVHDPASADALSGVVPLVLAGHTHHREVRELPRVPDAMPTQLQVQGSTGGAGLRGLEGDKPTPLAMSVLYFDQQRALQAYDDILLGGTGEAQVNLERHVVEEPEPPVPATPTPGTPTPASPVPPAGAPPPDPTPTG